MSNALANQTPAEIDKQIAELVYASNNLQAKIAQRRNLYAHYVKRNEDLDAIRVDNEIEELVEKLHKIEAQIMPFNAEFQRRGGWTRAYLVNNSNGHVHRTTSCSTCFIDTSFLWVTDYSGKDEQEIVDAAGERACTVCYASAPVELRLDRKTQIFTPEEVEAAKAREERAAKRAQAARDAIVVLDYTEFDGKGREHTFKTERAATNAIARELTSLCFYGTGHPSAPRWLKNIESIREALTAKGVEYDYEAALVKARKRNDAEARKYGTDRFARF